MYTEPSATRIDENAASVASYSDPVWVRVVCDPDDASDEYVKVYAATSKSGLASASACYVSTDADLPVGGGFLGFGGGFCRTVDDVEVEIWDGDSWETESAEGFQVDGDQYCENEKLLHDVAGNLTYDGEYKFKYHAWNRLVEVKRYYCDEADRPGLTEGSVVATVTYDGLGRRIKKFLAKRHQQRGLELPVPFLL